MAAPSFFNCFYFPSRMGEIFAKEVLFCDPPAGYVDRWTSSLRRYLGKLAALHPNCRLLVKNPAHSARIAKLQTIFPGAKFIHIHRDPIDVVSSTHKLYRNMLPIVALQDYEWSDIERHIIWSYKGIMDRLFATTCELSEREFAEVSYRDLVDDPIATVAAIYRRLDLGDFEHAKTAVSEFARLHAHTPSPGTNGDREFALRHADQLAPYCERLGYCSN